MNQGYLRAELAPSRLPKPHGATSRATRALSNAAVNRDLPIPASPETSTTCPSLHFAFHQRRSSNWDSSSLPTNEERLLP